MSHKFRVEKTAYSQWRLRVVTWQSPSHSGGSITPELPPLRAPARTCSGGFNLALAADPLDVGLGSRADAIKILVPEARAQKEGPYGVLCA
jgi:hypothetical protein